MSVILCGFNQAQWLQNAIGSVLTQTFRDLELLIIDNGSTDGSDEIILRQTDPRVDYTLYVENDKPTVRLNQAIRQARGEFISILYADDYYLGTKLEHQMKAFASLSAEYGVVYGPGCRQLPHMSKWWFMPHPVMPTLPVDPTLKRSGWILKDMLRRHYSEGFINPITPLIRKACFERDPFNETVGHGMEAIFMQFALSWKFHYLDKPFPLAVMREFPHTEGKLLKRNKDIGLVWLDALLADPRLPVDCMEPAQEFRAQFLALCGWCGLRELADPAFARQCFREAIGTQSTQLLRPRVLAGLALSLLPSRDLLHVNHIINDYKAAHG